MDLTYPAPLSLPSMILNLVIGLLLSVLLGSHCVHLYARQNSKCLLGMESYFIKLQ